MSRALARRLELLRIAPAAGLVPRPRLLSQTTSQWQDKPPGAGVVRQGPESPSGRPQDTGFVQRVWGLPQSTGGSAAPGARVATDPSHLAVFKALSKSNAIDTGPLNDVDNGKDPKAPAPKLDAVNPYHMHVYSHKHNTHITFTRPNREPIISLSCGNIGYRKSRRGSFESAYSLTRYVFDRLDHMNVEINRLELVLRGYGQGRDAVTKVILSPEGKAIRNKIVRVADATRVKFAGTRSKRRRRL